MYEAKERGRNQYGRYSKALGARATQRLALENDLHRALARNELMLHYQLLVDLVSAQITAVEAMLRWERSGFDAPVFPAELISVVEHTGPIIRVGERVLRTACT
jgi:EAL domain-containing protein (putative c-di-GMP-specific phosphodiesterase class I)